MNKAFQYAGRRIQNLRKAAFSGGVYVGFISLLLLALYVNRGEQPNDWVTLVILTVSSILFLIHAGGWLFLKLWKTKADRPD